MSDLEKQASGFGSQSFNDYQDDYDYEYEDLNNQINEDNIDFIPESEILKERENLILEAKDKLFLERDQAILAMIYYEWKEDNLDNWYEDVDKNRVKAGIDLSPETRKTLELEGVVSNGDNS